MSKFQLIKLPYEATELSPIISLDTINLHHGKHLAGYVNNLNNLIVNTEFENLPLEEIVKKSTGAIFNNAGQIFNHNFYFSALQSPKDFNEPSDKFKEIISKNFGSFDAFKEEFSQKAVTLFGSGWAWLSKDSNNNLVITQESNANNPLTKNLKPLLTFDVWEHAYYVDYQNRRADYVASLWKIVNWNFVESNFSD